MAKKALVTGAAGFIGSHLVEELVRSGCDVRGFIHYNSAGSSYNLEKLPPDILDSVEIVAGDIMDGYAVDKAVRGCETVFHLAALIGIPYSYSAPSAYVNTNVTGTLHVLEACLRNEIRRLVHTSSSEVYGTAQYVPIDEAHPLVAQSPYSATKIAADKLVESFCRSFDLPACIVRPFNTYGPRQSARAIVPTIIVQALSGNVLHLGSIAPVRDLTFVTDTAKGLMAGAIADDAVGQVVNLGTGTGNSICEIVDRVGHIVGRQLEVIEDSSRVRPQASEVMELISDNSKAERIMGWRPSISLDIGLKKTMEYLKEHLKEYRSEKYCV